ncbi:unnamed protein product [Lota lota]
MQPGKPRYQLVLCYAVVCMIIERRVMQYKTWRASVDWFVPVLSPLYLEALPYLSSVIKLFLVQESSSARPDLRFCKASFRDWTSFCTSPFCPAGEDELAAAPRQSRQAPDDGSGHQTRVARGVVDVLRHRATLFNDIIRPVVTVPSLPGEVMYCYGVSLDIANPSDL